MTTKRKSMAGAGRGMDAYFDDDGRQDDKTVSRQTRTPVKQQNDRELQRATFYIRPDQHFALEELKLRLGREHVKTNKSELVREAIDLLADQELEKLQERIVAK